MSPILAGTSSALPQPSRNLTSPVLPRTYAPTGLVHARGFHLSAALQFLRKHWFTIGLLVGSLIAVNWVVTHKRAPGSMTVIEAQSMDMTDMKAPVGVMPVAAEAVRLQSLDGGKSFPATISAFTEEEVVARVPGRLSSVLVYPGDKVRAGQLLAIIDAPEYDSDRRSAEALSGAKSAEIVSAERMIAHHRNALNAANANLDAAKTAKAKAGTDVETASLELAKSKDDLVAARAAKAERQAELTYDEQDLARERSLYKQGAVALDEVQSSQRDHDAAASRVATAQAAIGSATQSVNIAQQKLLATNQMVTESDAQVAIASSGVDQAQEAIAQAHADANATRFQANAATSDAAKASTIANYRQLRALADGVVSDRLISPGTSVIAGQAVLRLNSINQVRVQADVPSALSRTLKVGDPVQVTTDSGGGEARITSIFPAVDPQTRTLRIEALMSNPNGALKPGMFAQLQIEGGSNKVLAVPTAAIQSDDSGKFVWTVEQRPGTGKPRIGPARCTHKSAKRAQASAPFARWT